MKEIIIQRINAVINALDNISVKGRANLSNLAGSIQVLDEITAMLREAEFKEEEKAEK